MNIYTFTMFLELFESVFRTILVGTLTYTTLIAVLRITGKRTLSKLNAFDFIITIALGSTVATVLLSAEVNLAEGITALLLLILLQFSITWLSVRIPFFRQLITSKPLLLLHKGVYLENNMKKARIVKSEILQAARNQGIGDCKKIDAVVLETSGELSVISVLGLQKHSTIIDVNR